MAEPWFFAIGDSYGIELCHPRREVRSKAQVGKKGKSNGRWIIGIKRAWLVNNQGKVVTWQWDTANVSDREFGTVEIGYGINSAYQRRGYATEMAAALRAWVLAQPTVERASAKCRMDNAASISGAGEGSFCAGGTTT